MQISQNLTILLVGTENLGKLVQIAQISCDFGWGWANWADFVQFTVNFESSIYHGANWKMVCKFHVIYKKRGLFGYLGGVHGFLTVCMCTNGVDFASFTV